MKVEKKVVALPARVRVRKIELKLGFELAQINDYAIALPRSFKFEQVNCIRDRGNVINVASP